MGGRMANKNILQKWEAAQVGARGLQPPNLTDVNRALNQLTDAPERTDFITLTRLV